MGPCLSKSSKTKQKIQKDFADNPKIEDKKDETTQQPKPDNNADNNEDEKLKENEKKQQIQKDLTENPKNEGKKEEKPQSKLKNADETEDEKLEENEKDFGEFHVNENLPKKSIDRKNSII